MKKTLFVSAITIGVMSISRGLYSWSLFLKNQSGEDINVRVQYYSGLIPRAPVYSIKNNSETSISSDRGSFNPIITISKANAEPAQFNQSDFTNGKTDGYYRIEISAEHLKRGTNK